MATYYVDVTTGDNGDDGLSEGDAWQTLEYAADQVAADDLVYIKGSASYVVEDGANDCILYITTAGTVATPIVWEGYTTTPGDNGVITFDADTNTLASAAIGAVSGNSYNVFKNIRFTGGSVHGVSGDPDDHMTFKNCRFDNNDSSGFWGDNYNSFYNCLFDTNGIFGCDCDSGTLLVNCIVHSNTQHGIISGTNCVAVNCIAYENGTSGDYQILFNSGEWGVGLVAGCTTDGGNVSGVRGIGFGSASAQATILNSILFDSDYGVYAVNSVGELAISDANLFFSNNTDRTNFITGDNDVAGTSDPFTLSAAHDYSLKSGSEAIDAGRDGGDTTDDWGL